MKLSVVMMIKNESKYLEQCLSSLRPIQAVLETELIIVDTGSEDNSVEIAKKYTDKVYFHQWNNDFAAMRNKTIQYAKGEWLLVLDGDEIIENPDGIIDFLNSKKSQEYNTGIIAINNLMREDDEASIGVSIALRLFRNKDFFYEGAIHEQPRFQHPIYEVKSEIRHYGYLSTDKKLMEYKFKRNTELLKAELEKDPENIYYLYQLSQSYGMYSDYEKSLEANIKAYEIAKKNNIDLKNRMYIYTHLALAYNLNKKYAELEALCLEAIALRKGYIDLYYLLAGAQKSLGKTQEAINSYEDYLELLSNKNYIRDVSVTNLTEGQSEYAYLDLCTLYNNQGNIEKAIEYADKITSENTLRLAMPQIAKIYIDSKKYRELRNYYDEKIDDDDKELRVHFWTAIENAKEKLEQEERSKIASLFALDNSDYSVLNKVRLKLEEGCDRLDYELSEQIENLDFGTLPAYFADIIYFYIKNNKPLGTILPKTREYIFQVHIDYLSKKVDDLSELMLQYLQGSNEAVGLNVLKVRKVLEKSILILDQVDKEAFRTVWDKYIEDGTRYISEIYNQNIIDHEMIYDVRTDEDAFLVFMIQAKRIESSSKLDYIKYLRKALKVYPSMKKGIELLSSEVEEKNAVKTSNEQNEFEELKQMVKKNIDILLETKKATEAKTLIDEYLKIVPNDIEMLMLKSELQVEFM